MSEVLVGSWWQGLAAAAALTMFVIAAMLALVFVLGFMLQRRGKPHNILLLTTHKLIAVAALVIMTTTVIRVNRTAPLDTVALVASAVTVVFFVVAIISGGLVSTDKPAPMLVRALHWVTPFATFVSATATSLAL